MASTVVPIICYDLPTISQFFRSCALAIATQQSIQFRWTTYRDRSVINAVYATMFWKEPPGTVDIQTGTVQEIESKTDELHQRYLLTWVRKLSTEGPGSAYSYASDMGRLRIVANEATQLAFREAISMNSALAGETQEAIVWLAGIKLSAQVGVAAMGAGASLAFLGVAAAGGVAGAGTSVLGLQAGAGGLGFAALGTANSVSFSLIRTWEQGLMAKIAAVSLDTAKATIAEGGGAIAGGALKRALDGSAKSAHIIKSAEAEITRYSARLAQEGLRKKAARKATDIVARRTAQVASQEAAQRGFADAARKAAGIGRTIPVVFAAWDIWDAVSDYRTTVAGER